jgi:hypothetical protein
MTHALAFIKAHWSWIVAVALPTLAYVLVVIAHRFEDPDNDPSTPPPWWTRIILAIGLTLRDVLLKRVPEDKQPPAPPAASLLPFIFAVALPFMALLAGCGRLVTNLYKSAGTAAVTAAACYRAVDDADKQREEEIYQAAKAGNVSAAVAKAEDWRPKYATARAVCTGIDVAAQGAMSAIPLVESGLMKEKDAAAWIPKLLALGASVVEALAQFGIHIGGVS